jgi:hypothetical protein
MAGFVDTLLGRARRTVTVSYLTAGGEFRVFEFDAVLSEAHALSAQATDFPVESGASISDHVVQKPDVLKLEGIVTNTPLPIALGWSLERYAAAATSGGFSRRANDAWLELARIKAEGIAVDIQTGRGPYFNMVLEGLESTTDAETGEALHATATFKRITAVASRTVTVPAIEKAAPIIDKGHQPTKPAPTGIPDSYYKSTFNPSKP